MIHFPVSTVFSRVICGLFLTSLLLLASACAHSRHTAGELAYARAGDEIVVAGQLFHTGAPVVLWSDPGGYDHSRIEKRFGPIEKSGWSATQKDGRGPTDPARFGTRFFRFADKQPESFTGGSALTPDEIQRVRGGGWDLPLLQSKVDQFVLHYDVCGVSKQCFRILHDVRGLSVHFMLDIDGTIYQTCDLKERTYHATSSNDRSVGIEIANMGAYADGEKSPLAQWYKADSNGQTVITIPENLGDGGVRTPGFVGRPMRNEPVRGVVQGKVRTQYDLTPQQYDSLIKLTAALCTVFPNLPCDYPKNSSGALITQKLLDEQLRGYRGVLGHYHIQDDKSDPGPALQWEYLITEARRHMPESARDRSPQPAQTQVGKRPEPASQPAVTPIGKMTPVK